MTASAWRAIGRLDFVRNSMADQLAKEREPYRELVALWLEDVVEVLAELEIAIKEGAANEW